MSWVKRAAICLSACLFLDSCIRSCIVFQRRVSPRCLEVAAAGERERERKRLIIRDTRTAKRKHTHSRRLFANIFIPTSHLISECLIYLSAKHSPHWLESEATAAKHSCAPSPPPPTPCSICIWLPPVFRLQQHEWVDGLGCGWGGWGSLFVCMFVCFFCLRVAQRYLLIAHLCRLSLCFCSLSGDVVRPAAGSFVCHR